MFNILLSKKQQAIRAAILDVIYTQRPISRIDIAKKTGITPATISAVTGELINEGLLSEIGELETQNKAGRKKVLLELCEASSYYLGAEISEAFLAFVLTDNLGNIIQQKYLPLDCNGHSDNFLTEHFIAELRDFITQAKFPLTAIGIALPGNFDPASDSRILTNNCFWQDFDLKAIKNAFDTPVFFANNVNCMALKTRIFQPLADNFIFLNVGRGIRCAYMYQGDIFSKNNFLIGELGHLVVSPEGELCECGKRGCLQTYASETWIIKKAKLLYQKTTNTYLHQLVTNENELTLETVISAYLLGDTSVVLLLNTALNALAITIANLNLLVDAKHIFIHGKLFENPQMRALLQNYLRNDHQLLPESHERNFVVESYDRLAGALGGCALCISNMLLNKND